MTGLEMLIQTKIGLTSSIAAIGASATAVVAEVSSAMPTGPSVVPTAMQFAGVAIITAIGSILVPPIMEWIKGYHATRKYEIDLDVKHLRDSNETIKSEAREAKQRAALAETQADELRIEVARYQERLSHLEGRTDRIESKERKITSTLDTNSQTIDVIKNVIEKDVLSANAMVPTASVITDAYGRILSVTGPIEFILQWKPEDLTGRNIRDVIPAELHPDPISHHSRSYDPTLKFEDRFFQGVLAFTKGGHSEKIDIMLTRWFEKGLRGKVEGVRFGKIIRKHMNGNAGISVPWPVAESVIPGFNREELKRNNDLLEKNNSAIAETNKKLDVIVNGTEDASR